MLAEENIDTCKTTFEGRIQENQDEITSQSPEIKSWDMVYALLFDAQLHYAIYKYSAGNSLTEVQPLIKAATENFITSVNHPTAENTPMKSSFFVYQECLSILSLNILIKSDHEIMKKLAATFDVLGKDALIDRILSYVLPNRKISTKLLWPKPYQLLYTLFDANAKDRPEIMAKYIAGWYKGMAKAPWYGSHKNTVNKCAFYGYWSFEAAAAVCLLNIDDGLFSDKLFYPKDFVDFNRNI